MASGLLWKHPSLLFFFCFCLYSQQCVLLAISLSETLLLPPVPPKHSHPSNLIQHFTCPAPHGNMGVSWELQAWTSALLPHERVLQTRPPTRYGAEVIGFLSQGSSSPWDMWGAQERCHWAHHRFGACVGWFRVGLQICSGPVLPPAGEIPQFLSP